MRPHVMQSSGLNALRYACPHWGGEAGLEPAPRPSPLPSWGFPEQAFASDATITPLSTSFVLNPTKTCTLSPFRFATLRRVKFGVRFRLMKHVLLEMCILASALSVRGQDAFVAYSWEQCTNREIKVSVTLYPTNPPIQHVYFNNSYFMDTLADTLGFTNTAGMATSLHLRDIPGEHVLPPGWTVSTGNLYRQLTIEPDEATGPLWTNAALVIALRMDVPSLMDSDRDGALSTFLVDSQGNLLPQRVELRAHEIYAGYYNMQHAPQVIPIYCAALGFRAEPVFKGTALFVR